MRSSEIAHQICLPWFCAIVAPISWKKAQFQDSLVWCGWEINFSHDTIQLVSAKLTKLDALIKALLGSRRVLRKTLDLGHQRCAASEILVSAATLGPQQPTRLKRPIPPQMWSAFRASLNKDLKTSHSLVDHSGLQNLTKFQVAPCTARTSRGCPALANPRGCALRTPIYTSLSKSSQQCLTWLALCFQRSPVQLWPAASTGCRGRVCRRRLGRDRGLGNHILPSSLVCQNLEHAGHTGRVALPCQAWTAVHRMFRDAGTVSTTASNPQPHWWWATRSACLQAQTIPQRKP